MPPTIRAIQGKVAAHYGLTVSALLSPSRYQSVARPRQVAMFIARRLTGKSRAVIGRSFGRDKSTVYHAIAATAARRSTDADLNNDIEILTALLAPAAAVPAQAQGDS